MRNTAFFVAGAVLLFLQSHVFRLVAMVERGIGWLLAVVHLRTPVPGAEFSIPGLVPSLVLPLIIFMGVHEYSLARGAGVVFALGYLTDLLGIAPVGLYTFTYVAIFVLARSAGVRLATQTRWMQVVLVFAFALLESVIVLVLLAIFGKDASVPRMIYPMILPHTLVTGAVSPLVFLVAQRLHVATQLAPRTELGGGPP